MRYQFSMQKRQKWDCPRCLLTHLDRLDFIDSCVLVNSMFTASLLFWVVDKLLFHHIPQTCDDFSLVIYDTDWWLCWFVWLRLSRASYWGLIYWLSLRSAGEMTKKFQLCRLATHFRRLVSFSQLSLDNLDISPIVRLNWAWIWENKGEIRFQRRCEQKADGKHVSDGIVAE